MKPLKDKFVPDDLWYFVRAYLDECEFKPIFDRHLEKYDKVTGRPYFHMDWLDSTLFEYLAHEAVVYYIRKSESITEETIEKYCSK